MGISWDVKNIRGLLTGNAKLFEITFSSSSAGIMKMLQRHYLSLVEFADLR